MQTYEVSYSNHKKPHSMNSDKEIDEFIEELFGEEHPSGFIKLGDTYVNKAHIIEIAPKGRSRVSVLGG